MTREQAVQAIENMPISHECREFFDLALEALKQPEVIRCKDCVNNGTSRCPCHYSGDPYIDWNPDDDWFCADGTR